MGLLLGVKREVAEDVLVMRTGSTRQTGSQAASLILKRHIGSIRSSFNIANFSCENVSQLAKVQKCEKCIIK